jgi:hypothetical protein
MNEMNNESVMTKEEMDSAYDECDEICIVIMKEIQKSLIKECKNSKTINNNALLYQGIIYDKLAVFLAACTFNINKEITVGGDSLTVEDFLKGYIRRVNQKALDMVCEKVRLHDN